MTAIKICGITRPEDLALCEELGVEYVGFNFVRTSPRCISIDQTIKLGSGLKRTKAVGIFVDGERKDLADILDRVPLDAVQIYNPSLEELLQIKQGNIPIIHAFRSIPGESDLTALIDAGDQILLDGSKNGSMADLSAIAALPAAIRNNLFLAGGLNAGNVAASIQKVQPFAIDAASGIESSPGIKDHAKVREFVEAVRTGGNRGVRRVRRIRGT